MPAHIDFLWAILTHKLERAQLVTLLAVTCTVRMQIWHYQLQPVLLTLETHSQCQAMSKSSERQADIIQTVILGRVTAAVPH